MANEEWGTPVELFNRMDDLCLRLTGSRFLQDVCASDANFKVPNERNPSGGYWTKGDNALLKGPFVWAQVGPCWMNPVDSIGGLGNGYYRRADSQ